MRITVVLVVLSWIGMGFGMYVSVTDHFPEAVWAWLIGGAVLTLLWLGIYGICRLLKLLFFEILHLTGLRRKSQKAFAAKNTIKLRVQANVVNKLPLSAEDAVVDRCAESAEGHDETSESEPVAPATLPSVTASPILSRRRVLPRLQRDLQKKCTGLKRWRLIKWAKLNRGLATRFDAGSAIKWLRLKRITYVRFFRFYRSTTSVLKAWAHRGRACTTVVAVNVWKIGKSCKQTYLQDRENASLRKQERILTLQQENELLIKQKPISAGRHKQQEFLETQDIDQMTEKTCRYCGESILSTAIKCKHCYSDLVRLNDKKPQLGLRDALLLTIGIMVLLISSVATIGFFFMSVAAPGTNVANLQLMNDRIVGVAVGVGGAILGAMIISAGRR